MNKSFYYIALTAALLSSSCSDKSDSIIDTPTTPNIPDSQKEMISFSMSDAQGAVTRSTRAGFRTTTGILMHIQSDNAQTDPAESKFTRTQATAEPEAEGKGYSNITFGDAYNRYWDDAHGRNSWLSIFAVAVPGYTIGATGLQLTEGSLSKPENGTWGTDNATTHKIDWYVKTDGQTSETNKAEDLVYARNIQKDGEDGIYWFNYTSENGLTANTWQPGNAASADAAKTGATTHGPGRMHFRYSNPSDITSAGKFDRGHLKFNHALTRLSITLKEGSGFSNSSDVDDFNFDDSKNFIQIKDANKKGTLNLVDGTWSIASSEGTGVVKLTPSSKATTESNTSYYTFAAQILPGNKWKDVASPKNVLEFYIDNNQYFVTEAQLYNALKAAKNSSNTDLNTEDLKAAGIDGTNKTVTLTQGVNYNLVITVDKKQIESITAVLASWSDVHGENVNIDNTHVSFTTYAVTGSSVTEGLHLFRLSEELTDINTTSQPDAHKYSGNYSDEAVSEYSTSKCKWSTNWFFENNKTAYHFRSVNTLACVGSTDNSNHDATGSETNRKQSNFVNISKNLYSEGSDRSCTFFKMTNGSTENADYQWGAPLVTTEGTKYYEYNATTGFTDLIHKGITSTKDPIRITQLHMMSQINVIVRTTDKTNNGTSDVEASNAITLVNGSNQCEVTLTRLYNHGKVDIGTGLIDLDTSTNSDDPIIANGVKETEQMTTPTDKSITQNIETGDARVEIDGKKYSTKQTKPYTFNVIPQSLYRGTKTGTEIDNDNESQFVGITIKTPDNNQYYVVKNLRGIKATDKGSSKNQTANSEITDWYPNHKYTYTFTITKKGIESITCTLADWVEVKGENTNIDLEN